VIQRSWCATDLHCPSCAARRQRPVPNLQKPDPEAAQPGLNPLVHLRPAQPSSHHMEGLQGLDVAGDPNPPPDFNLLSPCGTATGLDAELLIPALKECAGRVRRGAAGIGLPDAALHVAHWCRRRGVPVPVPVINQHQSGGSMQSKLVCGRGAWGLVEGVAGSSHMRFMQQFLSWACGLMTPDPLCVPLGALCALPCQQPKQEVADHQQ
jgi:hypothetical protein